MSETKDTADKPLTTGGRKPLSLQRTVESGHVRQSFSHGRSKSVVVEKRKTRKLAAPGAAPAERDSASATKAKAPAKTAAKAPARPAAEAKGDAGKGDVLRPEERDARARALAEARKQALEDAKRAEDARASAPEPAPPPAAEKPTSPPPAAEAKSGEAAPAREAREPEKSERPARTGVRSRAPGSNDTRFAPREGGRPKQIELPRPPAPPPQPDAGRGGEPAKLVKDRSARPTPQISEEDDGRSKRGGKPARTPVKVSDDHRRERGKLTINNALDEQQRERSLASLKRKREREKLKAMGIQQPRDKIVREVIIPEAITIQELSNRMTERGVDVIRFLMKEGAMHKITDVIDADTAELIVTEFGHTPKRVSEADVETGFIGAEDTDEHLQSRAPVVTIMGHVDHGKTSLLDAIRQANVVSGEAGGITQHIGAYQVKTPSGSMVTFIDTPGHAAFTAMRARGAKVTDIVVLVVAADDGVMPQTIEAINHAKAANVPIIVAINKIDKPQADPKRVQTELLQHEIVVESMGGETLEIPVSALKHTNLDKLLEAIHLQAEILELKANPDRSAEGIVIEAKLERGRGPVGTVLVQRGTLHVGDIVVAGASWGRVRALVDDVGKNVSDAGPSVPVEILGFNAAPEAGDQFAVVENEARAREITDYRARKRR